jgi:uncharacterized 2Fe-2S/4Fe-4S cluster protein (DUF4445 family)
MPSVTINGQSIDAPVGSTLFEAAAQAGVRVPTSCVAQGKCKECIVEVTDGMEMLDPRSSHERHLKGDFRLSCQCRIVGSDADIRCQTMRRGHMRIERHALNLPTSGSTVSLDPAVIRQGSRVVDRITGKVLGESADAIHGLAMDLGTTTVVLRLMNLETGELVADASFENPQRFGGSDVMSRIHFDTEHKGKLLRRTLAGYLTHAIDELPVDPRTIYEVVVVGNSTMRDLFFRQNVYSIGQNPYRSITEIEMAAGKRTTTSLIETGRRCLLPVHPDARVYGLPIISGHVGADAAACMLAVGMAEEERLVAIMDIGTNTELILGNKHKVLAASCPAGPAFEGGAIACGMPGLDGAVEDVMLDDSGTFTLGVIGGGIPEGICGSGLVDLMSELLRTGRMNEMGRFDDGVERFTLDQARDLFFLESDVNELAQAKGANVAGLHVVFSNYGLSFDDVAAFYLAGGFGRHLKKDASKRIGLIPNLPDERIVQIGNAAIEGASIALLSVSARDALEGMVKRVEHCRLETHPDFFEFFVEGCQFKRVQSADRVIR